MSNAVNPVVSNKPDSLFSHKASEQDSGKEWHTPGMGSPGQLEKFTKPLTQTLADDNESSTGETQRTDRANKTETLSTLTEIEKRRIMRILNATKDTQKHLNDHAMMIYMSSLCLLALASAAW